MTKASTSNQGNVGMYNVVRPRFLTFIITTLLSTALIFSFSFISEHRATTVEDNRSVSRNTGLSERESYDFFHYSDALWKLKKEIFQRTQPNQKALPVRAVQEIDKYSKLRELEKEGAIFYQSYWEPEFTCNFEERVGGPGDGGKWLCDAYKVAALDECYIMSIGSNNDFSFEAAMHSLNRKCQIHTFDHTVGEPVGLPPYVNFHGIGIGAADEGKVLTMGSLLKKAGLDGKKIDVLKIDCEGCEADVYPQFFKTFIRQVLIELHYGDNKFYAKENHQLFEDMKANGYAIFHKEANILGCGGRCIEYGFVKLNLPK